LSQALLIRPRFDTPTSYSWAWAGELAEEIKGRFNLTDLSDGVSRAQVEEVIKSKDPYLIVFYDHGIEGAWIGNAEGEHVIDLTNVQLLTNRIAYSMSCLSAKGLGVEAYKKGCKVFVGYTEEFTFNVQDEGMFKDCANYGLKLWLKGESDWAKIKQSWIEFWNKMIDSASDPWTKMFLRSDRDALRVITKGVDEPTETKCFFRSLALKLFGTSLGWKITRKAGLSTILLILGLASVLTLPYIGIPLILISYLLITYEYLNQLK